MLTSVVLCSSFCFFENPEDMGICWRGRWWEHRWELLLVFVWWESDSVHCGAM
jgi:hypothetical protein